MKFLPALYIALIVFMISCFGKKDASSANSINDYKYTIDDQKLYDSIMHMDSLFFTAYNNCASKLDEYSSFYSGDLEFYHDKGGRDTSKASVVEGTKKYVCGKVTRELVKGSIEIYPIKDFGAVEMGLHKFINKEEPEAVPHNSRFTIIWQRTNTGWKISRVISLH